MPVDSSWGQWVRIWTYLNLNRLFEGPKLDMANCFSNVANLLLTTIFFHPLLPLSIPIAFCGLVMNYWANKIVLLRRSRTPEQMSGLMAKFFANLLPYIAMLWSVVLLLFYRTLYRDLFDNEDFAKVVPPLAAVVLAGLLLILPVRTCINKCY